MVPGLSKDFINAEIAYRREASGRWFRGRSVRRRTRGHRQDRASDHPGQPRNTTVGSWTPDSA